MIELLMVVAVVLTLTVLLLPVLLTASQRAMQTDCRSNQNRVGMALLGWAEDHDHRFPHNAQQLPTLVAVQGSPQNSDIRRQLLDYTSQTRSFYCPASKLAAPGERDFAATVSADHIWYYQSYVMLAGFDPTPFAEAVRFETVRDADFIVPAGTDAGADAVLLADLVKSHPGMPCGQRHEPDAGYHLVEGLYGGNVLFADGSVRWRQQQEMTARLVRRQLHDTIHTTVFFW